MFCTLTVHASFNRLLELIQESKSLVRLGIQVPDAAIDVLKQVSESVYYVTSKILELTILQFSAKILVPVTIRFTSDYVILMQVK